MEALTSIDAEIVLWLNQWVGSFDALDAAAKLIVGDYFIPVSMSFLLLAAWFMGRSPEARDANQRAVLRALLAIGFANLVVLILNDHYFRLRPFAENDLTLLFYEPTDSSFPANPAAVGFAMASGMWQGSRRLGGLMYALAALWGPIQDLCRSILSLRRSGGGPDRHRSEPCRGPGFEDDRTPPHPGPAGYQGAAPGLRLHPFCGFRPRGI